MVNRMNEPVTDAKTKKDVPKILAAIGSPLKFFALAIIVCNTIFGVAAATMKDPSNFKYSIHMFLAIVGAVLLVALWSPRSLYHPSELENIPDNKLPKENSKAATVFILVGLAAYITYQIFWA